MPSLNSNKSEEELFKLYETARESCRYNMIIDADEAMKAAGLTHDEYWFVVNNYSRLNILYGGNYART